MRLEEIDPNFLPESAKEEPDIVYYNAAEPPFRLHGLFPPSAEEPYYRRMPKAVAERVNPGVYSLHTHTAGGRVRFCTDSPYVAIYVKIPHADHHPHMPLTCSLGFDLYQDIDGSERYAGTFVPPMGTKTQYSGILRFPNPKETVYTLNFPLYNPVDALFIGLKKGSVLNPAPDYLFTPPVVYYGSSITQGGCASRPGNSYQAILSRLCRCDYWNLGFSGNAKGETVMAEYIAGLNMRVFVYDYDHNAPNVEHLRATHAPMFRLIRKANPELPIIMISRPKRYLNEVEKQRLEVIRATFEEARAAGDRNVYLLDGSRLMDDFNGENATVDGTHPTDLGFTYIAKGIEPLLRQLLK